MDPLALSPAEAARLASVPERTIWNEIAAGRLRSFKLTRDPAELLEMIANTAQALDGPMPSRRASLR